MHIGTVGIRLNHIVEIGVMKLNGKSVLHAVDEETQFTSETFLRNQKAEETVKKLLRCWSRIYLRAPGYIIVASASADLKNFLAMKLLLLSA